MAKNNIVILTEVLLFQELSQLIEQSKVRVVSFASSTLTTLFWQVGKRINEHILQDQRAEYAKQIVPTLSAQLEKAYGRSAGIKIVLYPKHFLFWNLYFFAILKNFRHEKVRNLRYNCISSLGMYPTEGNYKIAAFCSAGYTR